jgi:hypothetical protein
MNRQLSEDSESRLARYVEGLTSTIGYARRAAPLRDYCVGLVEKSVECRNEVRWGHAWASNNWPASCRNMPGARSLGGRERTSGCARALPASKCTPRRSGVPHNGLKRRC